jgi:hypothetical protein
VTQTSQDGRRWLGTRGQCQRLREVIEIGRGRVNVSSRPQLFERTPLWEWSELRDGSTTICDLDHLTPFDQPEQLAGTLSELSHTHRRHVLHIAHLAQPGKAEIHGERAPVVLSRPISKWTSASAFTQTTGFPHALKGVLLTAPADRGPNKCIAGRLTPCHYVAPPLPNCLPHQPICDAVRRYATPRFPLDLNF